MLRCGVTGLFAGGVPASASTPLTAETFRQSLLQMQQHLMLQQQQFLRDLIDRINPVGGEAPRTEAVEPPAVSREELLIEHPLPLENLDRVSPLTVGTPRNTDTFLNANATKWLATQIPEFGGLDSDNVNIWTKRVDKVALIHGASNVMTLLAASSKLVKNARQWYNLQEGPSNESWTYLKRGLIKMFDKKIPFFKTM